MKEKNTSEVKAISAGQRRAGSAKTTTKSTLLLFVFLAFFMLGFISGTILWSKSYTASEIEKFVISFRSYYSTESVLSCAMTAFLSNLPYLIMLIAAAFFAFGWLLAPPVVFLKGMGLGVCMCCLCSQGAAREVFAAVIIIAIPSLLSVAALLLAAREAARLSGRLFLGLHASGRHRQGWNSYLLSTFACVVMMAISAWVQAFFCRLAERLF